jgi:hypothetical protein
MVDTFPYTDKYWQYKGTSYNAFTIVVSFRLIIFFENYVRLS